MKVHRPRASRRTGKGNAVNTSICTCRHIAEDFDIDGALGHPLWERAEPVFLVRTDTGEPGRFATEARLLWSDSRLYIGFRCEDDYVWGTRTERDSDIYEEECVEVFISPAGVRHQYYEINVSPKNVVFDACILNGRRGGPERRPFFGLPAFDLPGLETRVAVDGRLDEPGAARGWTAEYAIPLEGLVGAPSLPPQPGEEWLLNLYRIDAAPGGAQEFYAWRPTIAIDFHMPECFGVLRFEKES
jgi:hypothetical protein